MPKPYYDDGFRIIYHGDCQEVLPEIDPVSLILTDPPYGLKITRKSKNFGSKADLNRKATGENWDDKPPDPKIWPLLFDKSENQIVFGANYFWEYFYSTPCYIIWDKRGDLPKVPFSPTELAWTSFSRMPVKYTCINHGFIKDSKEWQGHPTQKPLKLFSAILKDFTDNNCVIADPFMGSGTTLRAAKNLNLGAIGIEIEEKYCEMAANILSQEVLSF